MKTSTWSAVIGFLLVAVPFTDAGVIFRASDEAVVTGNPVSVSITVENFADMTSAQFSLAWDPSKLQYSSAAANGGFPPAIGAFGTTFVIDGKLGFSWAGTPDATVANGTTMFSVNFNAIGVGLTQVDFGSSPTSKEITANNGANNITSQVTFDPGDITISSVPEPVHTTLAAAAFLVGFAVFMRYRRSRARSATRENAETLKC